MGHPVVTLIVRWNRKRCDRPDLTVIIVIVNVALVLVALSLQIFHHEESKIQEKTRRTPNKHEFI